MASTASLASLYDNPRAALHNISDKGATAQHFRSRTGY